MYKYNHRFNGLLGLFSKAYKNVIKNFLLPLYIPHNMFF